jgi:hypothetical protein
MAQTVTSAPTAQRVSIPAMRITVGTVLALATAAAVVGPTSTAIADTGQRVSCADVGGVSRYPGEVQREHDVNE